MSRRKPTSLPDPKKNIGNGRATVRGGEEDSERVIPDDDMAEESAYPGDDYWQETPGSEGVESTNVRDQSTA